MKMKYLACLLFCAAMLAQEGSTTAYEMYAGYYGVATMKAKGCTVVSLNPFKLDLPANGDPFAGPPYSLPDITGVKIDPFAGPAYSLPDITGVKKAK